MVEEIIIYPVKSLGGTRKTGWQTTNAGFLYDRNWMLIDENGQFLTQREIPALCTFFTDIHDNEVTVVHEKNSISWTADAFQPDILYTKVWDDPVAVHPVNPEIDAFFSDILHKRVFLVKHSDIISRKHPVADWNSNIDVSLADGYPYQIVGTSSVSFLREKAESPVTYERFRPNILVSTTVPHEEDEWPFVRIGTATFRKVKPCARCQVVNINPADGTIDNHILKVLSSYRRDGHKVNFGTLMVAVENGTINVGDEVRVYPDQPNR